MRQVVLPVLAVAAVALGGCASSLETVRASISSTIETVQGRLFDQGGARPRENNGPPVVGASPSQVAGEVQTTDVIDGDTIALSGRRIRLFGIDAPEMDQTCVVRGEASACGTVARNALIGFLANTRVVCTLQDTDRFGRDVSLCSADGADIGELMVRSGQAFAYREYSTAYVAAEQDAMAKKRGVWAGEFDLPWDWRRR